MITSHNRVRVGFGLRHDVSIRQKQPQSVTEENDNDGVRLAHARFTIDSAVVMIAEHFPEVPTGVAPPTEIGGTGVTVRLELDSREAVDEIFQRAPQYGAEVIAAPELKPWNEYYGRLKDPFGHVWAFGAQTE